MSGSAIGISYGVITLLVMFSGMPIAFGLGSVAIAFMFFFMPADHDDLVRGGGRAVTGPLVPGRHWARCAAGRAFLGLCRLPLPQRSRGRQAGTCRRRWHQKRLARRPCLHPGREGGDAAPRAALRGAADWRDGGAVRRLRHAFGNRGAGRHPGAGADCRGLRHPKAGAVAAHPVQHHQGEHDADVHHRHVALVFLRDEFAAHLARRCLGGGGHATAALGAAGGYSGHGHRAGILPAAGVDHSHDRAHHPAAAEGRGLSTSSGSAWP